MKLKKGWQQACCLVLSVLTLGSCSKEQKPATEFNYFPVQMSKGDSWSIVDKDGKEVVKEEYPAEARLSVISDEGAYWVRINEKYQLYNLEDPKKPVIDEEFTRATRFQAGVALVSNPNQPIRIINAQGATVATLSKDISKCYKFSEDGYATFLNADNKCGVIDKQGKVVVKAEYSAMMDRVYEGTVLAQKNADDKKWLILDMKGQKLGEINREQYTLLGQLSEGKRIVRNNDDEHIVTTVLDKTGKKLFDIRKAKEKWTGKYYIDNYIVYGNGEGKFGVADDKGESVIRAKYDRMENLGKGRFMAKKGDKCGVVNEKDETVLDFEYDDVLLTMGSNYLIKDGAEYALVNSEGKEVASFYSADFASDSFAEYVDVEGLANFLMQYIEAAQQAPTAAQVAKTDTLDIDNFHYRSHIGYTLTYGDKMKVNKDISFYDNMAEEKTHEEEVNDGWFTTKHTVSDGWQWTDALPARATFNVTLTQVGLEVKDFFNLLSKKMEKSCTKTDAGTYTRNVKSGGKTLECETTLTKKADGVIVEMQFNQ